jgi:hypothetical protein
MDENDDFAGCLVDVHDDLANQRSEQTLFGPLIGPRVIPPCVKVFRKIFKNIFVRPTRASCPGCDGAAGVNGIGIADAGRRGD